MIFFEIAGSRWVEEATRPEQAGDGRTPKHAAAGERLNSPTGCTQLGVRQNGRRLSGNPQAAIEAIHAERREAQ